MLVKQTLRKVLSTDGIYFPRCVPCLPTLLSHFCIAVRSPTNVLVNFHHHRYFCGDHQHQPRSIAVNNNNNKRTSTTFAIIGSIDFTNTVNIRMFSSSANNENGGGCTIAVCQLTAKSDKEANFAICKNLIESAACAGAKVVFLPEACDYVAESKQDAVDFSEPLDGKVVCDYKDLAKSLQVWLSLGGIHERVEGGKVQNAHLLINDQGEVVSVYRKLHLFDVEIPEKNIRLKESDYVKKGEQIVPPVSTPVGEIGLAICYDMRFPELAIVLRNMGAKILTYPSAFTFATGAIHWEVLLRSRAIENQCYVVAAAQTGHHNKKRSSWGHAMVIDPLGSIVAQCSEGTGFALATIDLESINNARKSMPIGEHKRTDVYPEMMTKKLFSATASDDHLTSNPSNANDKYQFGQVVIPDSCVFYKTALTMAFVNKRCVVPGHVLIAPLRPALRLVDLNEQEVTDLFLVVQKVQKVMELVHGATSTTIAVQDGPEAGRTIKHLHVHILPRRKGDFLQNDEIYYQLQQHDKVDDKPWRSEEEMNTEAAQLIKHFTKSDS